MDDDETPGEDREREGGAFAREYDDADFLAAVEQHAPARTGDVADAVGCHPATAYRRLRKLEADGALDAKSAGATTIWTIPENHQ